MKKNNIKLGINLDEIIEEKNLKKKAEILARIKQNIFLCNKDKVQMKFIIQKEKNNRNIYDLKSFRISSRNANLDDNHLFQNNFKSLLSVI